MSSLNLNAYKGEDGRVRTFKRSFGNALASLRRILPLQLNLQLSHITLYLCISSYPCLAANIHKTTIAVSLHLLGLHVTHTV